MLNKKKLVYLVKEDLPEFTLKEIESFVDVFTRKIIEVTALGEGVQITNFATIQIGERKSYETIHPQNPNTKIVVPPRKTINFQPSEYWKNELNK